MVFNSFWFLCFFPVVLLGSALAGKRLRPAWLLAASWFWYLLWDVRFAAFLLFSVVSTYFCGRLFAGADEKRARLYGTLCALANLGVLLVVKYTGFFVNTVNLLLGRIGAAPLGVNFKFLLPVGISFYTLTVIGYLADVRRGKAEAETSFVNFALFVSFFPQMLSGPIPRADKMLPQYRALPAPEWDSLRSGFLRLLWGLFLKLVVTERLAVLSDTVFNAPDKYRGPAAIVAAVCYGLQIYGDFAGYSHMALGVGEMLGVTLPENFDTPYLSQSVGEFWRRWHMSLSTWFRDYIYIPLGGNRHGALRKYLNLMIVFAVSGLWHGADWTFVVWGLLNGAFQVLAALLHPIGSLFAKLYEIDTDNLGNRIIKMLVTFACVDFCWIFFRAATMDDALTVIRSMFVRPTAAELTSLEFLKLGLGKFDLLILAASLGLLLTVSIFNYNGVKVRKVVLRQSIWWRWAILLVSIFFILIFGMYGPAYSASNFIYAQF